MLRCSFQRLWLIRETEKMILPSNKQETRNEVQSESTFIKLLPTQSLNLHCTREPHADGSAKPFPAGLPFLLAQQDMNSDPS